VRDFDALANASKQHGVVAHNVAAPDGGKADAGGVALAGDAFAGINRTILEVTPQRTAITSPIFRAVPDGASTL
jgi:hypothetical protein